MNYGEIAQGVTITFSNLDIRLLIIMWLLLCTLILLLAGTLFVRYTWPTVRQMLRNAQAALYRRVHCAWCWHSLHIMRWYPPRWSSSMCARHKRQARAQLAARRARRNVATTLVVSAQHQHAREVQG